jgi:hypothetical protein
MHTTTQKVVRFLIPVSLGFGAGLAVGSGCNEEPPAGIVLPEQQTPTQNDDTASAHLPAIPEFASTRVELPNPNLNTGESAGSILPLVDPNLAIEKAAREKAERQLQELSQRRTNLQQEAQQALESLMEAILRQQSQPQYRLSQNQEDFSKTEREVEISYLNSRVYVHEFLPADSRVGARTRMVEAQLPNDATLLMVYDAVARGTVDRKIRDNALILETAILPSSFRKAWKEYFEMPIELPAEAEKTDH